ncbi:MAG: putative baseplate assembly protein, partial [Chloroflexi bacterium]|nr:putative baseplate assembly protein [Chloroflexota bacterium]
GEREVCLPRGTTHATLRDEYVEDAEPDATQPETPENEVYESDIVASGADIVPGQQEQVGYKPPPVSRRPRRRGRRLQLEPGDILIFEEVKNPETDGATLINPRTGFAADANPKQRHAVRLTRVTPRVDRLYGQPVLDIEWDSRDALPFPLCISAVAKEPPCELRENISVARGNVILVDHGQRLPEEPLGEVPVEAILRPCVDENRPAEIGFQAGDFSPVLHHTLLTFSAPLDPTGPASTRLRQDPRAALPAVRLVSAPVVPGDDKPLPLFELDALDNPAQVVPDLAKLKLAPAADDTDTRDEQARKKKKLEEEKRRAARYLQGMLSPKTRRMMNAYQPGEPVLPELINALAADLRRLVLRWEPRYDLLDSGPHDQHFVVEMDNQRFAHLRFGDGDLGRVPPAGMPFVARYRVGNGPVGNIGAEGIKHIVSTRRAVIDTVQRVRNPLPAQGGTLFQPLEDARLQAPYAFQHNMQRAITAQDYADIVVRDFPGEVQRAGGALRWTGSWYEVLVAVDPRGGTEADPGLMRAIRGHLHPFRRMGHDVVVEEVQYVPLEIDLTVCLQTGHIRGHVRQAVLDVLSARVLPGGRRGFFHPDHLTFGQPVYLSALVAAVQAVPGVENVIVHRFARLDEVPNFVDEGVIHMGPLEAARLDSDPNFPENGILKLRMGDER